MTFLQSLHPIKHSICGFALASATAGKSFPIIGKQVKKITKKDMEKNKKLEKLGRYMHQFNSINN